LEDEKNPAAVELLMEALKDPFVDITWLAAKSLRKMVISVPSSRSLRHLIPMTSGSGLELPGARKTPGYSGTGSLLGFLKDPKKLVRKNAGWTLGRSEDIQSISGLTEVLLDDEPGVRDAVQAPFLVLPEMERHQLPEIQI
jgi:HEAT repeat protein